jgi:hypothetical protein
MRGTPEARLAKRQADRAALRPVVAVRVQQVQAFRGVGAGTLAALQLAMRRKGLCMDALLYGLHQHAKRTGWL